MILGLLCLVLLFFVLRLVFGLAGWLLGLVGAVIVGGVVLLAFAALFKVFLLLILVIGGVWAARTLVSR
ncbi:hypothetical protein FD30_GL001274 [Levilactobacillus namurensis DSM 19117]|uniref:Uncharacterized protein n=1 Tax=Levilactobacillus namurensis DSM 19117 TaxID=1423773 RepID=A0A0R1JZZ4_9LACO|nr:hypothetical protein [Levilactobacillus namurensis]KRK76741.1 hypothetical protein FD30_GL001274 [Levilactobacillus namurensis DSM 19117]GEO73825.1 hypothetical protein LNA02_05230 [Levilactobacillus namurensis]HJE45366.1 hypothetical protein [Levilactobacillus namurensis]